MNIPFFDLKRQYETLRDEVEKATLACMESCGYIEGQAVKDFEAHMSDYLQVKHVIGCASGTDALELALKACGVKPGDEVITTAFSFFATAEAIARCGARPVFADVRREDYNIDPADVEKRITERTKAILPVHIFGAPADMKVLREIADRHGLRLVEDACQAIGSRLDGKAAGVLGDIAGFSFYPTKNLGAFGDGGMISTNDDELATVCRALKAHGAGKLGYQAALALGQDPGQAEETQQGATELYDPYKYFNYVIGGNSRLDSMQAAVLDVKLAKLDEFNAKRAAIAEKYSAAFAELPLHLPVAKSESLEPCWHQYVFLTEEKEALMAYLGEQGVGTGAFYPVPLHLQKAFHELGYKEGDLPVAEELSRQSVCLPVFPELTEEETDYVIEKVQAFFKEQ